MSDGTRISGYGGYGGFTRQQSRSASLERFRKGRRPGEIVSGVFLRHEAEGMGWAMLEGEELLAMLPAEGPRPEAGATVYFRVETLHPEVVLRMLSQADPAIAAAQAAGSRPLSQHAALYVAARDTLDTLAGRALWNTPAATAPLAERKNAFAGFVASSSEALDAYAETLLRGRVLLRAAQPAGLIFFRHMPWLAPSARGVEVTLWHDDGTPVRAGAALGGGARFSIRGRFAERAFRYRLEYSGAASDAPFGAALEEEKGIAAQCLGFADRVAVQDTVGGILASIAGTAGNRSYSRKL